jgi:adenine-specific DNA methylase
MDAEDAPSKHLSWKQTRTFTKLSPVDGIQQIGMKCGKPIRMAREGKKVKRQAIRARIPRRMLRRRMKAKIRGEHPARIQN